MRRSTAIGATIIGILAIGAIAYEVVAPRIGAAVLARQVAQFRADLGPDGRFAYAASETHPLQRSASFSGVVLHLADGTDLTADQLDIAPAGPHALRHLHLARAAITHLPAQPGLTVRIADLAGDGLNDAVAPLVLPPPATPGATTDPLAALAPDIQARLRQGAQALRHVQADSLAVRGLAVDGTLADGKPLAATLASAQVASYGPNRSTDVDLRTFTLPDIAVTAPDPNLPGGRKTNHVGLAVGGFAVHKVRLADALAFLAAGRADGEATLRQPSDAALDDAVATLRIEGQPPVQARIGHVGVQEHGTGADSREDAALDGLDLPAARLAVLMPDSFADGRVHGHAALHAQANSVSGAVSVQPIEIGLDHIGKLRIAGSGVIDLAAVQHARQPSEVAAATTLSAFSVGVADGGLRQGLLKVVAARSGAQPEMVAQMFAARARATVPPELAPFAPAIAEFIERGGALQIDAHPAQPVRLQDLLHTTDPVATAGQLKLNVQHTADLN